MSRITTEKLHEVLSKKKLSYSIRVTTYLEGMKVTGFIHGSIKNNFIDDCIKREWNESKMAGHIIDTYYAMMHEFPEVNEKEPNEIKKFIIDRIKL